MSDKPRVIRIGVADWIVLDAVLQPRYAIHYGAAVHRDTGETHMKYQVDHWVLERAKRWPLGYFETIAEASDAAIADLTKPNFSQPQIGPDGRVIPRDELERRSHESHQD